MRSLLRPLALALVVCLVTGPATVSAQDPVTTDITAPGSELVKLATGYTWAEGPAEDANGDIYFTDNREQLIHRWSPDGTTEVFRENARGANGLYFDGEWRLVGCIGADRAISYIGDDASYTLIVDSFDGNSFNSPNDLWINAEGAIYFTDPSWGRGTSRVMYVHPDRETVTVAADDMVRPNGIIGTPDGSILYISDWDEKKTYRYTVRDDGTLADRTLFAPAGDDGMTIDSDGNVYLTGDGGVLVYSPDGEHLETIGTPERPHNVIFYGPEKDKLFITARTSVYSIDTETRGVR